jgi:signal transduction histidine kinase
VGGVVEIQRLQTELVYMARKVKASQESLHDYISAITGGQEEERARLARELHDDTIQSLIVLNQRTQLAQLSSTDSSDNAPLSEIQGLVEQTIANLRRLIRALRPLYLEELGLAPALEMLAREMNQGSGLTVEFHRTGAERRLSPDIDLALYRMAQEALNNVVRHAGASRASLTVQFRADAAVIAVSDNGRGFSVPQSPADYAAKGHFGLLGLYERADLIGATVDIQSSSGLGAQVTITLPASPSKMPDKRRGDSST